MSLARSPACIMNDGVWCDFMPSVVSFLIICRPQQKTSIETISHQGIQSNDKPLHPLKRSKKRHGIATRLLVSAYCLELSLAPRCQLLGIVSKLLLQEKKIWYYEKSLIKQMPSSRTSSLDLYHFGVSGARDTVRNRSLEYEDIMHELSCNAILSQA